MLEATGRLSEQRLAEIDFVLELIRYTSLTIGTSIVMHVFVTIVGLHGLRRWIVAIFAPTACLAALVLTFGLNWFCLLYTSPSPRDQRGSRMPSSA